MSIEFFLRLVGMVVLAVGGIYLGVYLGRLAKGVVELWASIFALVGALTGLIVTPFLTTRPVRAFRTLMSQVSAQTMVAGLLGLIVGLVIAALVAFPLSLLPPPFGQLLPFIGAVVFVYLGIAVFVMRQNDIRHLFRGRLWPSGDDGPAGAETGPSVLLDTSVIIDGRISDIARTGFISGTMLVPSFVLIELQHIADSSDGLRRQRGRRGLDILNRLQKDPTVPIRINDLANAVKAVYLPGESLDVQVIQEGKEIGQGVGYLDDGTMVVVEEGKNYIDRTVPVTVTKVLQTAAGRMIFARPEVG